MATVEGRGLVPPAPVLISIPSYAVVSMQDEASRRAGFRNYGGRSDQWGRGLFGNSASAPILVGLVGEWAFADFVNSRTRRKLCETDFKLRKKGDGGCDFRIAGKMHQLKTRRKANGANLIRRMDESGNLIGLLSGRYVFAQWDLESTVCRLLGWCTETAVLESPFEPSPVGMHSNLCVADASLNPMGSLIAEITADMEEQL